MIEEKLKGSLLNSGEYKRVKYLGFDLLIGIYLKGRKGGFKLFNSFTKKLLAEFEMEES
jgi:hypothetical protein